MPVAVVLFFAGRVQGVRAYRGCCFFLPVSTRTGAAAACVAFLAQERGIACDPADVLDT